jgi:hypothetical protein
MNEIFILKALKAIVEIALYSMIGQGIVGLLAGASKENNFVYVLLRIITSPATKLVRLLMPKVILDRYIPIITFGILVWVFIGLTFALAHQIANASL